MRVGGPSPDATECSSKRVIQPLDSVAMNTEQKYLSTDQVRLRYGGIGRTTLWRWVRDGRLPKPYKIGPQYVAWLAAELDKADEKFPHAQSTAA